MVEWLGSILVVAFVQDFGLINNLDIASDSFEVLEKKYNDNTCTHPFRLHSIAKKIILHPIQIKELAAFYKTLSDHILPAMINVDTDGTVHHQYLGKPAFRGAPPMRRWSDKHYELIRENYIGKEILSLFKNNCCFLTNNMKKPLQLGSISELPY